MLLLTPAPPCFKDGETGASPVSWLTGDQTQACPILSQPLAASAGRSLLLLCGSYEGQALTSVPGQVLRTHSSAQDVQTEGTDGCPGESAGDQPQTGVL